MGERMPVLTMQMICLAMIILYSIIIYHVCSYLNGLSFDHRPLPREYSLSHTQKSRSGAPTWLVNTTTTQPYKVANKNRPLCDIPTGLGPISVNMTDISLKDVEKKYPQVKRGGCYSPPNCTAQHKVAIIVPYRDRMKNLAIFLNHMHPFLMKQNLEYGIFVVEQSGTQEFNRGKLLNVGFLLTPHWPCYIFHDIDLLPIDERNIYSCPDPNHPRMLDVIAGLDEDALGLARRGNFGGVSALTEEQFNTINGYSNKYWGWGGEDNDLSYRLDRSGYSVTEYDLSIARYATLPHKQESRNPKRYRLLLQTVKPYYKPDGLSTLHYAQVLTTNHPLYTHIEVNIDLHYYEMKEMLQDENDMQLRMSNYYENGQETVDPFIISKRDLIEYNDKFM